MVSTLTAKEKCPISIQHITELFSLDGLSFVTEIYRNLLQREPDPHGLAYYLGRLAQGHGKRAVIAQIAQSKECRPHREIPGLKNLITEERHIRHWLWGAFSRRNSLERILQSGIAVLETVSQNQKVLSRDIERQAEINNKIHQKLIHICSSHLVQAQVSSHQQTLQSKESSDVNIQSEVRSGKSLSDKIVRQAYIDVLGREPESQEAIDYYSQRGNINALYLELISSDEFIKNKATQKNKYSKEVNSVALKKQEFPVGINESQRTPLEQFLRRNIATTS